MQVHAGTCALLNCTRVTREDQRFTTVGFSFEDQILPRTSSGGVGLATLWCSFAWVNSEIRPLADRGPTADRGGGVRSVLPGEWTDGRRVRWMDENNN